MRERTAVAAGLVLAGLSLMGAAAAADTVSGPRQVATVVSSTRQAGTPAGSRFTVDWRDPSDPEAQAPGIQTMVIELPRGSTIDTEAVPRCEASDAELIAVGASACPSASRIGSGTIVSDAGPASPFPRFSENQVTIFNAAGEQVALAETTSPPTRVVGRTRIEGRVLRAEIPSFPPGAPPNLSLITLKRLDFRFDRIAGGGRAYARTPPACPREGRWTTRLTFVYRDEVSERLVAHTPCRRDRSSPRLAIRGVPRHHCAAHAFRVRARVRDDSLLRRVVLRLDGRRLRQTRRARFAARVPLGRVGAGPHRLRLAARDVAGNAAAKAIRFRRCSRR